jgi:hypothetical protein
MVDPEGLTGAGARIGGAIGEGLGGIAGGAAGGAICVKLGPGAIACAYGGRAVGRRAGRAAGAAAGQFIEDCIQSFGEHCRPYYEDISRRLNDLRRRLVQFRADKLRLPETSPPGSGIRSRAGEARAFYDAQAGLRRAIARAIAAGCFNIPGDAWRLATMPLDRRYPRPYGHYNQ